VAVILVPLTVYVGADRFLGIYVASACSLRASCWRAVRMVARGADGVHQRGAVLDLRDAVPRAAAQGAARSGAWIADGDTWKNSMLDGRLAVASPRGTTSG
jgi:hypothetical protein